MLNSGLVNVAQTVLTVINVALIALLMQVGCVDNPATPDVDLMCTVSNVPFLSVTFLGWAAAVSNALKLVVLPWLAPGGWVRNLFGDKTVVTAQPLIGTVAPTAKR